MHFTHQDGGTGKKYFVEVMAPGCGAFDYNGDGWADIYLVNGGVLPGYKGPVPKNQLYRNNKDGTFTDVTAQAGVPGTAYGIGCAAGDFDNDGHLDLYVTQFGKSNVLYRNNGDGTFTDITAKAGVAGGGFSSGATFGDYDGDGLLDLYVARYVIFDPLTSPRCYAKPGDPSTLIYCKPTAYDAAPNILYHNEGGGRFKDVSKPSGILGKPGRSLGCQWFDYDNDGRPDLYVANDMSDNNLFHNLGGGKFEDVAFRVGAAVNAAGSVQAGMGLAIGDYNGDGRLDAAVTNFTSEYTALYRNDGPDLFTEVSAPSGLVEPTRPGTGFGVGLEDLDQDTWPDLLVVNGHVTEDVENFYAGISFAQPNVVLRNNGAGGFTTVANPGAEMLKAKVHRGAAFADFDHDGRIDVLISNWRGEPDLMRNVGEYGRHYLKIRLQGTHANRDGIGARVTVTTGGRSQVREVYSGGSYCSQSDLPLIFGLGTAATAETVTVRWPGGKTETRRTVPGDSEVTWVEGK